jgi:hypothetical protein
VRRAGWDNTFWNVDATISAILGDPVGATLGTAVVNPLVQGIFEKDAASALPTTLMPAAHGTDRSDFIRIDGAADRTIRNNTCVFPTGFACDFNPILPPSIPDKCIKKSLDHWAFVNLHDCGIDDGIYVVFWSSSCDNSDCKSHAGNGDSSTFGFFEVVQPSHDVTFDFMVGTVLAKNATRRFSSHNTNTYTSLGGTDISFVIDAPVDTWGPTTDPIHLNGENVRGMTTWRPAHGTFINNLFPTDQDGNDWRTACVEIDNSVMARRLILDFSQANNPAWWEISTIGTIKVGCARERCPPNDFQND